MNDISTLQIPQRFRGRLINWIEKWFYSEQVYQFLLINKPEDQTTPSIHPVTGAYSKALTFQLLFPFFQYIQSGNGPKVLIGINSNLSFAIYCFLFAIVTLDVRYSILKFTELIMDLHISWPWIHKNEFILIRVSNKYWFACFYFVKTMCNNAASFLDGPPEEMPGSEFL